MQTHHSLLLVVDLGGMVMAWCQSALGPAIKDDIVLVYEVLRRSKHLNHRGLIGVRPDEPPLDSMLPPDVPF